MSISLAIFTFINIWWLVLFFMLALGVKKDDNAAATDYKAAPKPFHWKKKLWLTTLVAAVITAFIAAVIASGVIPVRDVIE